MVIPFLIYPPPLSLFSQLPQVSLQISFIPTSTQTSYVFSIPLSLIPLILNSSLVEFRKLPLDTLSPGRPLRCQAFPSPCQSSSHQGFSLRSWPWFQSCRSLPRGTLRGLSQPKMVHYQHRRNLPNLQARSSISRLSRPPTFPNFKAKP